MLLMATLSLSLLGPFTAFLDERPLTKFTTNRVQALLIYLAMEAVAAPLRRDKLMGLLWPDLPQESAQTNLRQTLYRLRKTIPELTRLKEDGAVPFLLADRQTVQINPDGSFNLDVHNFTNLLKSDETHWPEAVDLYRGSFLPNFYLPDSAPFEEWAAARRSDLLRHALDALDTLTTRGIQTGDLNKTETYARRQLEIDDLRESAHRQLMETLARNGRRRAAISHYEKCRQLLHDELEIEPTLETQKLAEAIRAGQFDDGATAVITPIPTPSPKPQITHNLPFESTPFFGREAELSALNDLMNKSETRLITIVGPGGMGKTRLSLETARQQLENFGHGVWFTTLAKLSSADEIVPATAQALHFSFYEGGTPRQQLLDYLQNKSLFLVMDNYEHLLDGADLVSDVLQKAPQVKILVTSREPLRLVEEQLFPLSGLTFSREDVVAGDAAVQLFLERARRLRPDLSLQADDMLHISTICRQVDGMPLGLELAAAWADTFSLADIAAELQQSLDLLESDQRNIPDRHRSLRTVFDASWERLRSEERQLFTQLSVFRGGFTRSAAKEIGAQQLSRPVFHRLLATLTRKSFLKHDVENGRYDIHELMRQFGAEKLTEDDKLETVVRHRHAAYYCEYLHQLGEDLKGPRQKEAVKELELDFENGRGAWNWAINNKLFDEIQKIIYLWDQFLGGWRSRHQEANSLYETLIKNLEKEDSLLTRQLLVQALLFSIRSKRALGKFDDAAQLQKKAQELFSQSPLSEEDIWPGKTFVLWRLSLPDQNKNWEWRQQGLDLSRRVGDRWKECVFLYSLGNIATSQGRFDDARMLLEEALMIGRALGDRSICADILLSLSGNAHPQYRFEEAEQWANEGMVIFSELEDPSGVTESFYQLGHNYLYMGRYAQSIKAYRDMLQLNEKIGSLIGIAWSHYWLSHTYLHAGEYTKSKNAAETCLSMVKDTEFERAAALTMLGNNALIESDHANAASCFAQSEVIMHSIANPVVLNWYQGYHVVTLVHCGKIDEARQVIVAALRMKVLAPTGITLFAAIAVFYWAEKRWERAIELYAFACTYPYAGKSQWVADVVGKRIDEAAAKLPPDVVEAARMRGQKMDMWEAANELLTQDFAQAPIMDESEDQSLTEENIVQQPAEPLTTKQRFVQQSLIAVGGHGELYLGKDTITGQQVVIKRIKPDLVAQHPEIVARFIREGEALRQLNHPNIVKMIAAEEQGGEHLIVMEYVSGGSLRQLLDAEGQLPIIRVLDIGLELADALTRAHHLGVIHRDIKPANVLLAEDGTPRLTDFGIARVIQQQTRLTQEGAFMGSPVYMSPEACRGEALDFRSDIWSFGALLHEMLAGRPPFATGQIAETLVAILNDPIPDLNQFCPEVPLALETLINSMLIKEPEKRTRSVRQVGAELEIIRNNLSTN